MIKTDKQKNTVDGELFYIYLKALQMIAISKDNEAWEAYKSTSDESEKPGIFVKWARKNERYRTITELKEAYERMFNK